MGFWSDKIYPALPVGLQNLAISAYGFAWQRRRFGGVYNDEYRGFKSREAFTQQQFADYQTLQLRTLLLHAFDTVPFYKSLWQTCGFSRANLQQTDVEGLEKLPFLEKNNLRQEGDRTLLSAKPEPHGQFFSSSGSTGMPTRILFSHAMHQRWSAGFEARIRNWAGVYRSDPRGMIGGRRVAPEGHARPPFYRYNFVEKQTYFSAYHISAENAADYLKGMLRHRVSYMTGYAGANYFLARFMEENGLEAPQLKAVLTSSEALLPEMRDTFSRVYRCRSFDAWSGVEACGLVSECEHGRLHISPDIGILEFLDPDTGQKAKPGQIAEVLCTGLLNFDQPLIRYRIGDLMRLSEAGCPCGREMPVVDEIVGRLEDTVIGPDGREMVRFHGIFIGISAIVEAQVLQLERDAFEIRIAGARALQAQEKELIRSRMCSQLGPVKVDIREMKQIPRGANGKFKAVVSNLKRPIKTAN